jgi:hypothetical protein
MNPQTFALLITTSGFFCILIAYIDERWKRKRLERRYDLLEKGLNQFYSIGSKYGVHRNDHN